MPEQVPPGKYEDIVNLQGAEAYCVATRTACLLAYFLKHLQAKPVLLLLKCLVHVLQTAIETCHYVFGFRCLPFMYQVQHKKVIP